MNWKLVNIDCPLLNTQPGQLCADGMLPTELPKVIIEDLPKDSMIEVIVDSKDPLSIKVLINNEVILLINKCPRIHVTQSVNGQSYLLLRT